ncbi:nucleoporin NUP35 isoform X1 [Petromyzon marinus]|uniref:Nucleoporin NUP53 n=1 Tax=Petromyzon marinus TaxID=7757 RepID=A0AAJ7TN07_PETMA|nr:nucleoporin NUP35 isoform X1 [Petromyzon marinus]
MEFAGAEPMTLGSPTSPKTVVGTQFLPGFLLGDLPSPATGQPRSHHTPTTGLELRSSPFTGRSTPQAALPVTKDKSGAPPVRSLYDDVQPSPLQARNRMNTSLHHTPLSGSVVRTPGSNKTALGSSSLFSPGTLPLSQPRATPPSPAQLDPFYTQGESLVSSDTLDHTWVTVFGFPPASASYILMQFAQYGNILKHVMSSSGNWMHIQYQSALQARKALSKDGKVFGECIMVGVKPCIEKNVMENGEAHGYPPLSGFTTPVQPHAATPAVPIASTTPRPSTMRPMTGRITTNDLQVVNDKQVLSKDDGILSKALEYVFGW